MRPLSFSLSVVAIWMLLPGMSLPGMSTPAAPDTTDAPLVDEKVRQAMQDRDYAEAVAAIEAASRVENAPRDYLAYLRGRALLLDEKYDEAVKAFSAMEQEFTTSPWARRARFARALALARKGDFRAAELIYRDEAAYLLSADRKQEIADLYLEFADRFFQPPEHEKKPDYQKALEFYQKALEVGPKPDKQIEVELLVAECHQKLDKPNEAEALYAEFLARHPGSPRDVEARYRLGQCRLVQGNGKEARRTWQDLLAAHPDSPSERIAEASFQLSRTWQIPQPADDTQLSLGVAALDAFIERFPTHKRAAEAHLDAARAYLHRQRFDDAAGRLERFLADERYSDRDEVPEARYLLGLSLRHQRKFAEALGAWRDYLTQHPAHNQWSTVQREIINTEYLMAQDKYQAKQYDEAGKLWTEFLAKYPLDERAPTIFYLFGDVAHRQEKWDEAIAAWRRLVSKYPTTDAASRAQYMIAATLEQKLGKLEEALEAYRKVTWGSHQAQANMAAARLTAKTMRIATDRVFRSDETPRIELTTRNVESVTVRAYKVDLETYFRKMHLARGVETLDVALIDPDKTFEFAVPDYAKYQELENTIEVPLPGEATSGVVAVTVSSKTLEATTLLIQSDLEVIVKSSRDEVFVFAQNLLTGKPWQGARLLISNGREVFAEAATGADGVFQHESKELRDAGDVRVFAVADGHVASNVVDLSGLGVSQGLSDKGYVYTDRPAYRAGQLVHVRGCLRHVPGASPAPASEPPVPVPAPGGESPGPDTYVVEQGKKYSLEVFDGRNRLVYDDEVALGAFGSFHAHFVLPAASPQGTYRILVHDKSGQSYQGTFEVHEYRLEPVRLVVDAPRHVYYRGEEIEGTIRAEFYYGAPLAGREIRYQLADDRLHTATTDAKGEVRFKLPTREFHETQVLPLVVTLAERNLQAAVNFVLATQGFSIGVSTVRPVYVAGETFDVAVTAHDAEGKPVARKLVLKVLERTKVEGRLGERLVASHDLETAEGDGTARHTLSLAEGGRYVLRVEGTDRFKNPIWGEHGVEISGDDDEVRLRILAERHSYKVGDTAAVRLHWREQPALALVAFQGARVLDYRLVTLATGENRIEIPMTARLAPNFELAVAVMADLRAGAEPDKEKRPKRLHLASSPFAVERDLRVSLAAARKAGEGPIRPGDELEVTVTTTDPQGRPVAAEVSLAMVEQSLLEQFEWPVAPIHVFFRGELREPAVRTTSSITFAYRPKTRPIDPELLAERERREIAEEEEASRLVFADRDTDVEELGLRAPAAPAPAGMAGMPGMPASSAGVVDEVQMFDASGMMPGMGRPAPADAAQSEGGAIVGMGGFGGGAFATDGRMGYFAAPTAQPQRGAGQRFRGEPQSQERYLGRRSVSGRQLAELSAPSGESLGARSYAYRQVPLHELRRSETVSQFWRPGDAIILNDNGVAQPANVRLLEGLDLLVVRGSREDVETVRGMVEQIERLAGPDAVLMPARGPHETAYWNPAVVTGDDGKATVTFAAPERSTAWTLMAKGITPDTLAGEATHDLAVKKDLFGQLKLPPAFTDGDRAEVSVSVHNDAIEKGQIEVALKTTIAGRSVEEKKTIDVDAKGIRELAFAVAVDRPEPGEGDEASGLAAEVDVEFELTVAAGERRDVVRRAIPVKPFGIPVFATASGSATSDTTAWVEPPNEVPLEAPSLQILIGPSVERSLLDVVLAPAPWCQIESSRIASGLDATTSDLMASLGLQQLVGATREAGTPQAQSLDGRIRSSLSLLVSSQNDDGAWSWTGRGGASDRYGTSRVVWALSLARSAGYTVPDEAFQRAVAYLRDQVAKIGHGDYESQTILLHALTAAGRGDFALANRLYRNRPALSPAALVYLALSFAGMDRKATAEELLGLLDDAKLDGPAAGNDTLPWSHAPAELRALYALATLETAPQSPRAKQQVDWLLAHRTGHRWAPDKATGPATLALCRWFAAGRFEGEHYKLAVFVNDVQIEVLEIDQASGTRAIDVPASRLEKGKQRINFQITGRGRYTYQCILGGVVPADKLAGTTRDWEVRRHYEPAPLEFDGRDVPRGFGVLEGNYSSFRNPLTELPVGRRGLVELYLWRHNVPPSRPDEQLEYLVVTEPIPSGASVIESSVRGGFERFEIGPGAITFYVGTRRHPGSIHYELHGYLPGAYRAGPTQVRNAYRPEQLAVSPSQPLEVLALGAESSDAYRLTPQELYELGKRHRAKGDLETAQKHLTELVDQWNLKPEIYQEAVVALLDAHLELGPAGKVVHYFEIVKEKWPGEKIPFAKIMKVGAAYHEMGEYERSYLVFRATVESSFGRESAVAGFLESQGEFLRSVEVMGRLLQEYPPEGYLAAAGYALAQRVYAKAPEAAGDETLRQQKVNRVDLVERAWRMLEGFLTAYPEDPAADQAAFSTANALLELESYDQAAAACDRYARRYPDSDLLDSFWYIIGYCRFATGEHAKALEMCRRVAEAKRVDRQTGREAESPNKWRAIYIMGQVHHSLGEAADAIREYRRVADRFADAKEAIEYFARKRIALAEVTTVRPGQPVEVELEFRNIAACDAKVYRIDLMKFSLLKRNLGGITQINLAGIRPYHEAAIALGDGNDYRDRVHKLALPLKDEGAYLVVCRGENLHASGLVLVTPLAVEVQEDVTSGRVRTTVKDVAADRYLDHVDVKVIGSRNREFTSGSTDLRGVFVADGIEGTSTVIAQAPPSRYAFFRGTTDLVPAAEPAPAQQAVESAPQEAPPAPASTSNEHLLEGLQQFNRAIQTRQVDQLQQIYKGGKGGVQASEAF